MLYLEKQRLRLAEEEIQQEMKENKLRSKELVYTSLCTKWDYIKYRLDRKWTVTKRQRKRSVAALRTWMGTEWPTFERMVDAGEFEAIGELL